MVTRRELLERRLARFFRENPDEELTIDDIVTKFGASRRYVHNTLACLRERGTVHTVLLVRGGTGNELP